MTGANDRILIRANGPVKGEINLTGAKNAALPLMCASLLTSEPLVLKNCPQLNDIDTLSQLIAEHGASIDASALGSGDENSTLVLHAKEITNLTARYELVTKMRASILVLGPLVARMHNAKVSLPGGCAIGARPVDLHLKGLEALGAKIELDNGFVLAEAPGGLVGGDFEFPFVSVGATENLVLAAVLARGTTTLRNVAREPEITDLVEMLIKMGAKIEGKGTSTLTITGVESLGGTTHSVVADRIVTGTFALMVGMVGGDLVLKGGRLDHLEALDQVMSPAGLVMTQMSNGLHVAKSRDRLQAVDVTTEPFPGFPTDLQSQLMAAMITAEGTSHIDENIFENRFMHVPEFARLGAKIEVRGNSATVIGVDQLKGAPVKATDLRAAVAMIMAGMVAQGETVVTELHHLDRGYENIEERLRAIGADIRRESA